MMLDIIVFENSPFRLSTCKLEAGILKNSTLESVFVKVRFRRPFSPVTCGWWAKLERKTSVLKQKRIRLESYTHMYIVTLGLCCSFASIVTDDRPVFLYKSL